MARKKGVIVSQGEWGIARKSTYENLVSMLVLDLEGITEKVGAREEKAVNITVVDSTDEALRMIEKETIDFLIFISRSMIPRAREVKKLHPDIGIVVLTGLIPDDEIIIIDKGWIVSGTPLLQRIVTE